MDKHVVALLPNIGIKCKRVERQQRIAQHFFMIDPKTFLHERINQYHRHDEPRNLGETVGIGGTDHQHPESIGDKERIIYPMVILVLEVAAEDEIVPHRYPHGTI